MRHRMRGRRHALLTALFAPLLASCGGSTAVVTGNALFAGNYRILILEGRDAAGDDSVSCFFGQVDLAGDGIFNATVTENRDGVIQTPAPLPPFLTEVAADRQLGFRNGGTLVWLGGIADDGRLAASTTVLAGEPACLQLFIRQEGSLTPADLDGTYRLVSWTFDAGGPTNRGAYGTIVFDGLGGATLDFEGTNEDGVQTGAAMDTGTYSVSIGGDVRIETPGPVFQGNLLLGGDVFMLTGAAEAGGQPSKMILVREAPTAITSTVSGSYHCALFFKSPGDPAYESISGEVTLDGAGNGALTGLQNVNGTVAGLFETFTYAVNAGVIEADFGASDLLRGGVSPGGRTISWGGSVQDGGVVLIGLMLRK